MHPELSIITVNFGTKALVRECIARIKSLSIPISYEIIVVDNEADVSLAGVLKERFPEVAYLPMPRNMGFSAGNNVGARYAKGDCLLFLNPDITVEEGAIETLLSILKESPDIGMVAPQLLNPDRSVQQSYYRFYKIYTPTLRRTWVGKLPWARRHLDYVLMKDCIPTVRQDMEWILGASFCMRRAVWERMGGMDERFFLYYEDVDLAKRLQDVGYRVQYIPEAKMIHLHGRATAGGVFALINPLARIHVYSALKYFIKHA